MAALLAAAGAVTAGQAVSAGSDTTKTAAESHGSYVATTAQTMLASRDASRVSRSGQRAGLVSQSVSLQDAAEQQAVARNAKLRSQAELAESFAEELKSDEWVLPTTGFRISTWFGEGGPYWSSGYHTGIDFATAYGTPVIAVTNAVVAETGWDGPYGNQIRLNLENGDQVWYNHLSSIEVTAGQAVTKGQEIGRVGDTGNSYGAHVHVEYRLVSDLENGVDPKPFFAEHGIYL